MDYNTKSSLIGGLADAFSKGGDADVHIDSSNYIENTGALETIKIDNIELATLRKTRSVIDQMIGKYAGSKDPEKAQYAAHLKVAKLCVADAIARKNTKIK